MAKTIGSLFIDRTISALKTPGADTPHKEIRTLNRGSERAGNPAGICDGRQLLVGLAQPGRSIYQCSRLVAHNHFPYAHFH